MKLALYPKNNLKVKMAQAMLFCTLILLCFNLSAQKAVPVKDPETLQAIHNAVPMVTPHPTLPNVVLNKQMVEVLAVLSTSNTNQLNPGLLNDCANIGFDPEAVRRSPKIGNFQVNYTGFSPEAQAAFQYAVDIWSRVIEAPVPIIIEANFTPLGAGVLGSANANGLIVNFPGAPIPDTYYPIALANQLAGQDLISTGANNHDINANFSSSFSNWYFGLDGCPPANQFDFVTVVLHEIGHGLGFFSSRQYLLFGPLEITCFGINITPGAPNPGYYIYDLFLENFGGFGLQDFLSSPGCFLGIEDFILNDQLVFNGPNVVECNDGNPAPIYSPSGFIGGSSTSHFDENSFPGIDPDALMTPFIAPGQAIHDPGLTLPLLRDLGYTTRKSVPLTAVPTMSQWGLMIFGLLVLNLGVAFVYRKEEILA